MSGVKSGHVQCTGRCPLSAKSGQSSLVLHFKDGFVLIHDHYSEQPEGRGTDYLAAVPMFAFDVLSVASFHNVVRSPFDLCGPFTGKDQMEFIPMMKVKRNHVAAGHFIDVCNDLLVGGASQIYFDQWCHLVSGKAGLILR